MDKVCIFCGQPPQNKNKEHIIPKWLMKLTGTDEKKMSVGTNWKKGKEIEINFLSFTFPSCSKCNTDFAAIEALIKPIVEKILDDDYVNAEELVLLLDWFDKVRISLWLAIQYHNNGTFNLDPKYYINTRLRLKDRLLAITNCYDNYRGLKWTGTNTLCFITSPTAFTLKINNVFFTNCSMDFISSKQLGFPFSAFEIQNLNNDKLTDTLLIDGTQKCSSKLFKSQLYSPTTIISQPIFKVGKSLWPAKYENDFVRNNSYDFDKGEGKLFVTHDNQTYPMEKDEEISFESTSKLPKQYKLNKPTLEFQIELLSSRNIKFHTEEQRRQHFSALKLIIDYTHDQIKKYNY